MLVHPVVAAALRLIRSSGEKGNGGWQCDGSRGDERQADVLDMVTALNMEIPLLGLVGDILIWSSC